MIIAITIVTVGALVTVCTVASLRFAEREMGIAPKASGDEQEKALEDVERSIRYKMRDDLRAILATRPHHLPDDVRERAQSWLDEKTR